MIKINLTPVEELEDQYWWAYDATSFIVAAILSLLAVQLYFNAIDKQVEEFDRQTANNRDELNFIKSDVDRFNRLNDKIVRLERKKESLQRITESKLVRFLPVILVENIQSLKPEGLWFTKIAFVSSDPSQTPVEDTQSPDGGFAQEAAGESKPVPVSIELEGKAFSHIIVAEFMSSLKATQNQEPDPDDIRTQVFFNEVAIDVAEVAITGPDEKGEPSFRIRLQYQERAPTENDRQRLSQFIETFKKEGRAVMR